ncbi:MAG: MG2 domain-containing protein [Bacteroidales bacterium]|nr:MG2 domain-containing protein [Bacteroidales bacterium]
MKPRLLHLLLLSLVCLGAKASDSIFASRLALQRYVFPQEKIHVSTDKPCYLTGDTIWMRAFVADAASHAPVSVSRYVYVELRNPFGEVVQHAKIMVRDSVYAGHLALDQELPEGSYTLVAYTGFMQSAGEAYFFKRTLEVSSIYSTRYKIDFSPQWQMHDGKRQMVVTLDLKDRTKGTSQAYTNLSYVLDDGKRHVRRFTGRGPINVGLKGAQCDAHTMLVCYNNYKKFFSIPRPAEEYEVKFYPEGGYLVPGVPNLVGVKALAENGYGRFVQGRIVDGQGRGVAQFATRHAGMGQVQFTPVAGETYTAIVSADSVTHREVALPQVRTDAAIICLKRTGSLLTFSPAGAVPDGAHIVVQQRGRLLAYGQGEFSVDEAELPAGVVQVLLLNTQNRALSERLFFVRDHSRATTTLSLPQSAFDTRQKVTVDVSLSGFSLPEGDYAVAVTDDGTVPVDSTFEIERQLLLQSDLRGYIEDPSHYFSSASGRDADLDALMLTQGWRRYNVPLVLRGLMAEPSAPLEKGFALKGRVGTTFRNKAVADGLVNVICPKLCYFDVFPTDSLGCFEITGYEFPEGTRLIAQALNAKGKQQANIDIEEEAAPMVMVHPQAQWQAQKSEAAEAFVAKEAKRMRMRDGGMMLLLDEVVVSAPQYKRPADMFEAMATRSVGYEAIEDAGYTHLEEVLRSMPGISIISGQVMARGRQIEFFIDGVHYESVSSVVGNLRGEEASRPGQLMSRLRGIVPDVPMGSSVLQEVEAMCPMHIVKRIDFVPSTNGVALGPAAANGAIVITTKDGTERVRQSPNPFIKWINVDGYQQPAEFYSPSYATGDGGMGAGTDMRSTLYWAPCVKVDAQGKSTFSFYTTDNLATTCTITIEGLTPTGEIIKSKQKFQIRK